MYIDRGHLLSCTHLLCLCIGLTMASMLHGPIITNEKSLDLRGNIGMV